MSDNLSSETLAGRETQLLAGTDGPVRTCGEEQPSRTTKEAKPLASASHAEESTRSVASPHLGASPRPWRLTGRDILDANDSVVLEMETGAEIETGMLIVAAVNAYAGEVHAPGNGDAHYPTMVVKDIEPKGGA